MSWAVSASMVSVILSIWPCFIRSLITSTARSAMRLASSWMVMTSGIVTSRTSFSLGSLAAWPLVRRCVRRRNDATERSRSSSAVSAVTKVSRPRRFSAPGRAGFGATAGRAAPPGRRAVRGASSSSGSWMAVRALIGMAVTVAGLAALAFSSSPNRFLASVSALRLASSSWRRRSSSSRLRASAASRSICSRDSRSLRRRASSSAIRRSSASRTLASASAWARALRSSSVRVRSTTPDGFPPGAAGAAAGAAAGTALPLIGVRRTEGAAVAAPDAGSAFASPGATMRRFTFSTTTALVRPWLKL